MAVLALHYGGEERYLPLLRPQDWLSLQTDPSSLLSTVRAACSAAHVFHRLVGPEEPAEVAGTRPGDQ